MKGEPPPSGGVTRACRCTHERRERSSSRRTTTVFKHTDAKVTAAVEYIRYDSDSTLRYAFKAKTGMSMREWRKKEGIA